MNLGGAFLIKELIDLEDSSVIGIPFKERLTLKIGLLWQKEHELHAGAKEFVNYVKHNVL